MSNFKFDKRAIEKAIAPAVQALADEMSRDYEAMGRRLKGKPVDEIKRELVRYHESKGGKVTDPDLTEYATAMSEGTTLTFRYGGTT